jgi:hypothetical protein
VSANIQPKIFPALTLTGSQERSRTFDSSIFRTFTGPDGLIRRGVIVTVAGPSHSKTVKSFNFAQAPFELWAIVTLADVVAANLQWVKQ